MTQVGWRKEGTFDIVNLITAVALFFAPWMLGFAAEKPAAWTAWLSAAAIGVVALAAILAFAEWEEWVNLVLGVWTVVSPWVVGFAGVTTAMWTHVIIGLVVAALAATQLWVVRHPSSTATA